MNSGASLKKYFMEMPDECFRPLTFKELGVGDKFIAFPLPGDNSGHGGFRGSMNLFTKTEKSRIYYDTSKIKFGVPTGVAIDYRGVESMLPHSMHVIKINT